MDLVRAVIKLEVPEYQIGQPVTIYFKDTMQKFGICDKEQEAVKPVLDEQTGRIWLCGKCGTYVGFKDNDPNDPNEFDKYCRDCGRPVLWEGR